MTTLGWMLGSAIANAWIPAALGQDVANKPDLRVGDTWAFHTTGDIDGKAIDRRWRRRIVELLPGDKVRVEPRYNVDVFDSSWNPIFQDRPDFSPLDFQFPLRVGAAWSYASPVGVSTVDGRTYDNRGSMKVVAHESITVPAGTFKCFRIEGEAYWTASFSAADADYMATEKWRVTNWYCPEVRYIGKSRAERYSGAKFGIGVYRTLEHELVAHRRGRPSPTPAVSTTEHSAAEEPARRSAFDGTWEGEQGIWRIKGRVSGQSIEGTIQCRNDKGWSAKSPIFAGIVDKDGSVDADTVEDLQGWAPRQINGKLPTLRVVGFGQLSCPNGEVALKKVE